MARGEVSAQVEDRTRAHEALAEAECREVRGGAELLLHQSPLDVAKARRLAYLKLHNT